MRAALAEPRQPACSAHRAACCASEMAAGWPSTSMRARICIASRRVRLVRRARGARGV